MARLCNGYCPALKARAVAVELTMLIAGEKPAKFLNLSIETCNLYIDKLLFVELLEIPNLGL